MNPDTLRINDEALAIITLGGPPSRGRPGHRDLRAPGDLDAFVAKIVEEVGEVEEDRVSAASEDAQTRRFRPLPVTFC